MRHKLNVIIAADGIIPSDLYGYILGQSVHLIECSSNRQESLKLCDDPALYGRFGLPALAYI